MSKNRILSLPALALVASTGCVDLEAVPDDSQLASDEQSLTGGLRFDSDTHTLIGERTADYTGDGKADFWTYRQRDPQRGMAIVGAEGGQLVASGVYPYSSRIDGTLVWNNSYSVLLGDVTGDGVAEQLVVDKDRGLRIVWRGTDGQLRGSPWHAFGSRVDGWLLAYDNTFYGSTDLDGDGNEELLVSSAWGWGAFDVDAGGRLTLFNAIARGRNFGGDLFPFDASTYVRGTGRFWGSDQDLLLIKSSDAWGLALVQRAPYDYLVLERAPFGQMQSGGWRIGSDNSVLGVGDVDGDQKDDVVFSSPWGLGVLTGTLWYDYDPESLNTPFKTLALFPWGTSFGGAPLSGTNASNVVDDFDGDGKADILVTDKNDGRLVLLSYDTATRSLIAKATLRDGERARGGWVYAGGASLVGRFADPDRASVLVRSSWGVGVLGVDRSRRGTRFYTAAASPYDPVACGNAACEAGETCSSCPGDCGACPIVCGNGLCESGESCSTCPSDCACPPPPPDPACHLYPFCIADRTYFGQGCSLEEARQDVYENVLGNYELAIGACPPPACPSSFEVVEWCCEDTKSGYGGVGCTADDATEAAQSQHGNCASWTEGTCDF